MRWTLAAAAAVALVAATGACGDIITVPDQGIIVTGCQMPAQCWRADCACTGATLSSCVEPCQKTNPNDPSTCYCMPVTNDLGAAVSTMCIESALACIGRGTFCSGMCQPVGTTCGQPGVTQTPPMLIPTTGMPMLEPHCQYTDDVCCGASDGGMSTSD